ncbi:recombinase family protein [Amycolatopsis sp. NPDC005003]
MTEEVYPKRAVIYLHTARLNDGSSKAIAAQRHACERRASELGLTVAGEYVDHGSGKAADRGGLIMMLGDLNDLDCGYVIAYGHAQIARDATLYASIVWAIEKSGARLEIASSPHREVEGEVRQLISYISSMQLADTNNK